MGRRPRHGCKEVEAVLKALIRAGWSVAYPSGHWGRVACPDGCSIGVPGTPRDCMNTGRQVQRAARKCPHDHAPRSLGLPPGTSDR